METHFSGRALAHPHKSARKTRVWAAASSALLALIAAAPAASEPAPPFFMLFRQAEMVAPRLAESDATVRAAEGVGIQAALRPNPSIGLEAENIGVSSSSNGLSLAQTTLTVSQPFELGGKRGARIAAAGAGLESARALRDQTRSDFAYDLALAYVAVELQGRRVDLAMEALSRAEEDERAARALVNAGREADLRSVQANAATTGAQADLESARADATEASVRLTGLVASREPYTGVGQSLLDLAGTLKEPPMEPPGVSPAVRVAQAASVAAAQRAAVERTRATPDLTAGLGFRRIAGENANTLVAGFSIPLPLFNNNSGAIAAATAELQAADARLAAARLSAEADWRAFSSQARAADRRLSAANEAENAANEAYRLARVGYDAGRTPLVELLTARRNLTEAQLRTLDARATRIRAEAALARLLGQIPFGDMP